MKYLLVLTFIFSIGVNDSTSQLDPPNMGCASVDGTGNVTFNWTAPADPNGEFVSYQVYNYDPITTSETLINTIANFGTTNYYDATADANSGLECYFIVTESFDGATQLSTTSDTICTMFLSVFPGVNPGTADVTWTSPQPWGSNTGTFDLMVEFPAGVWTLVETFPFSNVTINHIHEVVQCSANLNFQVIFHDESGCQHLSNIAGGLFTDEINPDAPEIIGLDVDSLTGNAVVNWNPPPTPDVAGYIIYECIGGIPFYIDTIFDPTITTYTYGGSQAYIGTEEYNVVAFDDCLLQDGSPNPGVGSPICPGTIFLELDWVPCTNLAELYWNPYIGWEDGVERYEIYYKTDPNTGLYGPGELLAVVDGNTTSFTHENLDFNYTYQYRVKAFRNSEDHTSASNVINILNLYPESPQNTYIATATVTGPEEIQVLVEMDELSIWEHTYILERLESNDDEYDEIDIFDAQLLDNYTFTDINVEPSEIQYTYRIQVENQCGDSVTTTNIARPILLSGLANPVDPINELFWTQYGEWPGDVDTYRIYRSFDRGGPFALLDEIPGSLNSYSDDVSEFFASPGEFCYLIEAVESGNPFGVDQLSVSNELCLTQEPKIWVPSAFVVNGFNDTFKPVVSFADIDNYQMLIYGRWGDVIFQTNDVEEGWNGIYKEDLVPEGQYAYFITIFDGNGRIYDRRGTLIMLIGDDQ